MIGFNKTTFNLKKKKRPTKIRKWTLLRGPFKHKKAQEAFERRTHRRLVRVCGEPSQIEKLAAYTELHLLPDTVASLKFVTVPRFDAMVRFSLPVERSVQLAADEEALRVQRHEAALAQLKQLDKLCAEIDAAKAQLADAVVAEKKKATQ